MNTTAVLSATYGGLSAQQKAAKLVDLMHKGWEPTTAEVAETFAMLPSSAHQMICRISGVIPLIREDAPPGMPGRWKTFDNT